MLNQEEMEQVMFKLMTDLQVEMNINGLAILLKLSDDMQQLELTTPVFYGGNYIPQSIRRGIQAEALFHPSTIKPTLFVDEVQFQVMLTYAGNVEEEGFKALKEVLDEFVWIAKEWRFVLERHGKEDLQFIYIKKS